MRKIDFNHKKALDYLLDVAYQRQITKASLCDGICDPSNFSKICAHKRSITLELLLKLCQKLDISFDELKTYATFDKPDEYLKIKNTFKKLRSNGDYKQIKNLYTVYSTQYPDTQLFLWIQGYCELFSNLLPLYAIDLFKKAIHLNKQNFSFESLNIEILDEDELSILYDILIAHMAHEELTLHPNYKLDYPINVSIKVINTLTSITNHKYQSILPPYCSLLANIYATFNNTNLLYHYTMIGINYCRYHHQLNSIPDLYLQLVCYEKLIGNEEHALNYLYQALQLYQLQNRPQSFYRTLPYLIKNFNLNIDSYKINQYLPSPLPKVDFDHMLKLQQTYKKR